MPKGKKKILIISTLLLTVMFCFFVTPIEQALAQSATNTTNLTGFIPGVGATDGVTPADDGRVVKFDPAGEFIYGGLSVIGALIAKIGGGLLDVSLSLFVVNMVGTMEFLGLDDTITYVWQVIRDLFNLLFIFGIVFIGFQIILGLEDSRAKKNLGTLLIAALLINFSLFVTQLVVDFGNIAAAEISNQFVYSGDNEPWTIFNEDIEALSSGFIEAARLDTITNNTLSLASDLRNGELVVPEQTLGMVEALSLGLVIALMFIVIGLVFAAGAFLMITRFIFLFVLMMFSPVMFLGMVLPKYKNLSDQWRKNLINQTLVGPAFLFMLWVSLYALQTLRVNLASTEMNVIAFMVSCFIVAGFAWMSLRVAKRFSTWTANTATSVIGGVSFGLGANILRGTVGRWAQNYADSDAAKDRAANSFLGRRALNLSRTLGDASFDARRVGGLGKRLDLGEGRKGGYKTITNDIAKREQTYSDNLGTVSDDDEKVASLQTEVDGIEQAIKGKKSQIQAERRRLSDSNIDAAVKREIRDNVEAMRAEVEDLEEERNKKTEDLSAEKQRRQLGSRLNIPGTISAEIKKQKETLEDHKNKFAAAQAAIRENEAVLKDSLATDADKDAARKAIDDAKNNMGSIKQQIATTKKTMAEAEDKANKAAGGYAASVENKNWVTNLFQNKSQNKNAAKEIRDKNKKKIKSKSKGSKDGGGGDKKEEKSDDGDKESK